MAEEWLEELPVEKWSIAYSPHMQRYGEMTSNAAESFNSWIREARELPITYMIDSIRKGLCRWYVEIREDSTRWTGALTPSKESLWHELIEQGMSWFVVKCPNGDFEVSSSPSVLVNLALCIYTNYQWQVRGFPCVHGIVVIRQHCKTVYGHVEDYFLTSNYPECYKSNINPIPENEKYGSDLQDDQDKILPPLTFNVSPAWKKSCLSSAGSKWRTFKTTLTKEYVYKRIDTPYLNIPPDGSDIDLNVWKDFVISRLSDKFKQMSDEHKELAKLNKWPHNLSRKGYARYASENQSLLSGDNDLDRATLWLEARKKKDGEFENDELKEIASKIRKKNSGPEYEVEGGILSQALESTEHSGRVRGIGGHVIPSSYVYLHNNKLSNNELCKQHEMELIAQRKRNIEQDERIRRLEEQIFKNHGHKTEIEELGSCTGKVSTSQTSIDVKLVGDIGVKLVDDDVAKLVGDDDDIRLVDEKMGLENDKKLKGKSVALILESGKNIVAYGTIIKVDDPLVPKNCMCVSIEKAEDKSAILPFPTGDCLTIDDAIGSHVTWPMHLMKLHDQVI
ncbi:hypothetical protein ACS0TY_034691 [Phlomoides rotata]